MRYKTFFSFFYIFTFLNLIIANTVENSQIDKLFIKKKITIVVTDSGLGGLSVAAGLENILTKGKAFEEVNLIFVNALPSAQLKYNSLKSSEEKAIVFSQVLSGIEKTYNPDIILIACNTLSVVYNLTDFSKSSKVLVVGIVESGVNLFKEKLKNINDKIVILGTETTIASNAHKEMLMKNKILEKQIINQACPNLETEIQNNPESDMVSSMLDFYGDEILTGLDSSTKKIYAGLCCSHYGYSKDLFQKILSEKTKKVVEVLNPNDRMIGLFARKKFYNRCKKTKMQITIVSQVEIADEEKLSISKLIKNESKQTSEALNNYQLRNDLFEIKIK